MPLYDYGCKEEGCKHVFESFHKISDPGPTECPLCKHTEVGRLISAVRGTVELSGGDLKAKIKSDAREISKKAAKDPNLLANLVGENKFHSNMLAIDKDK